jgi:hypothetical protein
MCSAGNESCPPASLLLLASRRQRFALPSKAGEFIMDATRNRRTRDNARRQWYASSRCRRFARLLGFTVLTAANGKKR